MEEKEVIYTGNVPQCPNCNVPTKRSEGMSARTCVHYVPVYDKEGNNNNPDRNVTTTGYHCFNCRVPFTVKGNSIDGYKYI